MKNLAEFVAKYDIEHRRDPGAVTQFMKDLEDAIAGEEKEGWLIIKDDWTPTRNNINGLPLRLRDYIHDLETMSDPAGNIAALTIHKDNLALLAGNLAEMKMKNNDLEFRLANNRLLMGAIAGDPWAWMGFLTRNKLDGTLDKTPPWRKGE